MDNKKMIFTRQGLTSFIWLCLLVALPFVTVGMLKPDFCVVNRMLLAYAMAVLLRQGFGLMFTRSQKTLAKIVLVCLMLIGAMTCAGFVAWRAEHWALCSCGQSIDEMIPARFYIRPILSAFFLIITSYYSEYCAARKKYKYIAKCSFYIACTVMAWFALDLADV